MQRVLFVICCFGSKLKSYLSTSSRDLCSRTHSAPSLNCLLQLHDTSKCGEEGAVSNFKSYSRGTHNVNKVCDVAVSA